jgi:hypothetical protein
VSWLCKVGSTLQQLAAQVEQICGGVNVVLKGGDLDFFFCIHLEHLVLPSQLKTLPTCVGNKVPEIETLFFKMSALVPFLIC